MSYAAMIQRKIDKMRKEQEKSRKAMEKYLRPDGTVCLTDLMKKKGDHEKVSDTNSA